MTCGDNINSVHKIRDLDEYPDVVVGYCERCKRKITVKKRDLKTYARLYKRDLLQPGENLYYKEWPRNLKVFDTKLNWKV